MCSITNIFCQKTSCQKKYPVRKSHCQSYIMLESFSVSNKHYVKNRHCQKKEIMSEIDAIHTHEMLAGCLRMRVQLLTHLQRWEFGCHWWQRWVPLWVCRLAGIVSAPGWTCSSVCRTILWHQRWSTSSIRANRHPVPRPSTNRRHQLENRGAFFKQPKIRA